MSERRVFDANERIPLALTAQQINVLIFLCRKARCADLCLDDILPVLHELETQPQPQPDPPPDTPPAPPAPDTTPQSNQPSSPEIGFVPSNGPERPAAHARRPPAVPLRRAARRHLARRLASTQAGNNGVEDVDKPAEAVRLNGDSLAKRGRSEAPEEVKASDSG